MNLLKNAGIFRTKSQKIIKLLSSSKQNFDFDQQRIKSLLLPKLNLAPISEPTAKVPIWPARYAYGLTLGIVLLASAGSLAYASSKSHPGEKLFAVQKLQNQLVLGLPLPAERKEQIRTEIVAQRLEDLEELQKKPVNLERVKAEVEESKKSINEAVNHLAKNLNASKTEAPKINQIADRLENLSSQHQQILQSLSSQIEDEQLKNTIEKSVSEIKISNEKLREAKGKNKNKNLRDQDEQNSDQNRNRNDGQNQEGEQNQESEKNSEKSSKEQKQNQNSKKNKKD